MRKYQFTKPEPGELGMATENRVEKLAT